MLISDFAVQALNNSLTFGSRVDPALLPSDDFAAAERRERSPAVECRQWQPTASGGALDPRRGDPVPVDTVPPLGSRRIRTHLGHRFMLVGQHDLREVPVESVACTKRFDSTRQIPMVFPRCTPSALMPAAFRLWLRPKSIRTHWKRRGIWSIRCWVIRTNSDRPSLIAVLACAFWPATNTPPIFRNGPGSLTWNETTSMVVSFSQELLRPSGPRHGGKSDRPILLVRGGEPSWLQGRPLLHREHFGA